MLTLLANLQINHIAHKSFWRRGKNNGNIIAAEASIRKNNSKPDQSSRGDEPHNFQNITSQEVESGEWLPVDISLKVLRTHYPYFSY